MRDHHHELTEPSRPLGLAVHQVIEPAAARELEGQALETVIAIALVVISVLEVWFIVRVVGQNMKAG